MWLLIKSFFKIGSICIGGGYAIFPLLEQEFVHKLKWLTVQELIEITSLSQIIPGPLPTTMATFIGKKQFGLKGSIAGVISILLPSFLLVCSIIFFFSQSFENPFIIKAMHGARIAVIAMIAYTVSTLFKRFQDWFSFLFFGLSFTFLIIGTNPIIIILGGGLLGGLFYWSFYIVYFAKNKISKKGDKK